MTLYANVKNNLKNKKFVKLLLAIVAGTASPVGCAYLSVKDASELSAADPTLIEVNPTLKDAAGNVAVRATAAGIAASLTVAATQAAPKAEASPMNFELETSVPLPVIKRGGVKADIYPFAKMEVNQSFHVAATEARPNPAKALASTVSSATKRFATKGPDGKIATYNQKFAVRAVDASDPKGAGARIWRVQ